MCNICFERFTSSVFCLAGRLGEGEGIGRRAAGAEHDGDVPGAQGARRALRFGGVVFGSERCARWSVPKRAVYLAGSWAIPALRLQRILTRLTSLAPNRKTRLLSAWPWLIPALLLHASGEALGYLLGPSASPAFYKFYCQFEQRRWDMVCENDRRIQHQVLSQKVTPPRGK